MDPKHTQNNIDWKHSQNSTDPKHSQNMKDLELETIVSTIERIEYDPLHRFQTETIKMESHTAKYPNIAIVNPQFDKEAVFFPDVLSGHPKMG